MLVNIPSKREEVSVAVRESEALAKQYLETYNLTDYNLREYLSEIQSISGDPSRTSRLLVYCLFLKTQMANFHIMNRLK
jgi:hypothetical protein